MPSAVVNASSMGLNHVVADALVPAGQCVRVIAWVLTFSGTVNATLQDTAGTPVVISGPLYGVAGSCCVSPPLNGTARGQGQTTPGKGLDISLSGATAVGGHVVYELAPQT